MSIKRVLAISDFHCGHLVGLTPPAWQLSLSRRDTHLRTIARHQREYWRHFLTAKQHGPYDVIAVVGDCIDGKGERAGGTELLTADRNEQVEMAVECIQAVTNPGARIVMVYGTPYHTGVTEDFERGVAEKVGATKIGGREWFSAGGVTFDLKHHIGSSQVPQGRHTAVARDHLWAQLWRDHSAFPLANVFLRGHVHYYDYAGGADWVGMTMPALQGLGSKYGTRACTGIVDFGYVTFECEKGKWSWEPHILRIKAKHALAVSV